MTQLDWILVSITIGTVIACAIVSSYYRAIYKAEVQDHFDTLSLYKKENYDLFKSKVDLDKWWFDRYEILEQKFKRSSDYNTKLLKNNGELLAQLDIAKKNSTNKGINRR